MNEKNCTKGVTIVQIPDECNGGNYLSTSCVQTPNSISYLDLAAGSNQTQINAALVSSLIYKDQQINESIPEAPEDGNIYGRQNKNWVEIPNKTYKEFVCLITQDGNNPPIIDVLSNDFTDVTFTTTYDGLGSFSLIPSTPFGDYRKMILTFPTSVGASNSGVICDFDSLFDNIDFRVTGFYFSAFINYILNNTIQPQYRDDIIGLYPFSIKIYN